MKICVCVKHVPDSEANIVIAADGRSVDFSGVNFILNPYDEFAVEAALQIREAGQADEVTILSVGPADAATSIRSALAMGADKGIHVVTPSAGLDVAASARLLAEALRPAGFDLILAGKMAIDDGSAAVGPYLAALLGLPSISAAGSLKAGPDGVEAAMGIEGGSYLVRSPLPAVVTCEKGLNEPRFATLPNIMKARRKPLEERPAQASGGLEVRGLRKPPARTGGRIVGEGAGAAGELVRLLQTEARVL